MTLEIQNMCSGYFSGVDVIHNIDLSLEEGSAMGILGLNGAGKSTLCRAIMNMNPYRQGKLFFNGQDISSLTTEKLARSGISFFMSNGNIFPELSVWENLQMAAGKKNTQEIDKIRLIFPVLTGDKKCLKRKLADKLSGGERNQLALAMCLLDKAKLLILDEPSAGLSPTAIKIMYKILEQIRREKGITILLIEQSAELIRDFCTQIHIIENGIIKH